MENVSEKSCLHHGANEASIEKDHGSPLSTRRARAQGAPLLARWEPAFTEHCVSSKNFTSIDSLSRPHLRGSWGGSLVLPVREERGQRSPRHRANSRGGEGHCVPDDPAKEPAFVSGKGSSEVGSQGPALQMLKG